MPRSIFLVSGVFALTAVLLMSRVVQGGAHSWRINEVFSNADGSVQFIEMKECCGGEIEIYLTGALFFSQATGNYYTFPNNLRPPSSYRHVLMATASFAALPGAPAPDYIIPEHFFQPNGDTLDYYVYDQWAIPLGGIPTDCVNSVIRSGEIGPNTPTNYAGQTGHVLPCQTCAGDISPRGGNGVIDIDDLVAVITSWNAAGGPADIAPPGGNGVVDIDDLVAVITTWGACP